MHKIEESRNHVLDCLPNELRIFSKLLFEPSALNKNKEVREIQRVLVGHEEMRLVWALFSELSPEKRKRAVYLFITKLPRLLDLGRRTLPEWLLRKEEKKKEVAAYTRTVKHINGIKKVIKEFNLTEDSAQPVLNELNRFKTMLSAFVAFEFAHKMEHKIHKTFGKDYYMAWDFVRHGGKNAVEVFLVRATYLLFIECGLENPQKGAIRGVACALLGTSGMDDKGIYNQIKSFRTDLDGRVFSFEKLEPYPWKVFL